jgi:hypothetical protein
MRGEGSEAMSAMAADLTAETARLQKRVSVFVDELRLSH